MAFEKSSLLLPFLLLLLLAVVLLCCHCSFDVAKLSMDYVCN